MYIWVECVWAKLAGGVKISSGCCLKASSTEPFEEPSLFLPVPTPSLHPHLPRRHRGVQGHGSHQLELVQLLQAHRCVWSWVVGYGRWGQDWKQMLPQGLIQRMVQELSPISPLPYAPCTLEFQATLTPSRTAPSHR